MEEIGFGFQVQIQDFNLEIMEQKELHLQLMYLVLGWTQLLGETLVMLFGYLEDMDILQVHH